ncbi:MAG: energy transducer TonB [Flavobacteriaceae bacterium]|nr:energy transducer TonB [Flavobacteriaceae bacterium]
MKNQKKHPKKQLEKYSNIFMQLSLVLVLFVVYQLIEHETTRKTFAVTIPETTPDYLLNIDDIPLKQYQKEEKKKTEKIAIKKIIIDEIDVKKNEEHIIKEIFKEDLPKQNNIDINKVLESYIPDDDVIVEDVDFIIIEDAPIYKGCEGLTKTANKKCFIKSIQKFVLQKFNIDLAQDLGLSSGKYKIFAQFVVAKDGNVTGIKIKAPHPKLKKEVNSIIKQLPKFTPGMQRNIPVNVKFTLPISFNVE